MSPQTVESLNRRESSVFTKHDEFQDIDLQRRVRNYLLGHRMPSLRKVDVEADSGTVVLRGQVHSFYQKQLCLHCCRRVAGVLKVIDCLTVVPP